MMQRRKPAATSATPALQKAAKGDLKVSTARSARVRISVRKSSLPADPCVAQEGNEDE
jgi:hypothetical protein